MYDLNELGFDTYFQEQIKDTQFTIGRVAKSANGIYLTYSINGSYHCEVSGKFFHLAEDARDFPSVGDWVLFDCTTTDSKGIIHEVLERKSLLSRHAAGEKQQEQLMAANVDTVFLVSALNNDFNLRRMERYLTQVYESGASPVLILTKKDLCDDVDEKISQVEEVAIGVPILTVDALHNEGMDQLIPFLHPGNTISLLGSSGVGKSTLINRLLGEEVQKTQGIREDDAKGRHTTTHRELFILPDGGVIIDTPGMRELQLWSSEDAASQTFQDIEALEKRCKFRDCRHDTEPGCAVKKAIDTGDLSKERYKSFRKLQREARFLDLKKKYGSQRASRIQADELLKGKW
ncbi:ribosome small subunit-dependent GTPase A [Evansella halocellulosilytica]|uniref:ribosome small subunit-dependent GTPase A n=1 Tax=Evansella halocellulosilytica TaxID=2011013 RepID=UPI000BB70B84|nr:ribosome small subunit-dependent GTPase A [Evansella halocellulosilytica]